MSNEDLYTKCPMCEHHENEAYGLDFCPVCKGTKFAKAGVSTGKLAYLIDGYMRAKHHDKYFESHKAEMNSFIDWLRENPYPDTP